MRRLALVLMIATALHDPAGAQSTPKLLYSFGGSPDGAVPYGKLLRDAARNLYGTTYLGGSGGFGTVYRLSPPAAPGASWTESVLYSFTGVPDGANPAAGLVMDEQGALYGTTSNGGLAGTRGYDGTVFRLSPPQPGSSEWTETVLFRFNLADGSEPSAALLRRRNGALFGTTLSGGANNNGTVFDLQPPPPGGATWTHHTLHSFGAHADGIEPNGLIADAHGNFYGTTRLGGGTGEDFGTVFELSPPAAGQNEWQETILHSFTSNPDGAEPFGDLVMDRSGTLYGTTTDGGFDGGTVFKLKPPAAPESGWKESLIYAFNSADGYPMAGLYRDRQGTVFGTTSGLPFETTGTVYRLAPPAPGSSQWQETSIPFGGRDGKNPNAPLSHLGGQTLVGVSQQGGPAHNGTVFSITGQP